MGLIKFFEESSERQIETVGTEEHLGVIEREELFRDTEVYHHALVLTKALVHQLGCTIHHRPELLTILTLSDKHMHFKHLASRLAHRVKLLDVRPITKMFARLLARMGCRCTQKEGTEPALLFLMGNILSQICCFLFHFTSDSEGMFSPELCCKVEEDSMPQRVKKYKLSLQS